MGKIQVLEKHLAELIAAGEVVERPASVVKELVENAIDSGASSVVVEIQHGGISFLRVTDNGCGIAREDVPTAFLRHATSKIRRPDDLDAIGTLGFRGEALASIAAVSHVELLTRTAEEFSGTRYVISGGAEESCSDAGCPVGTTILVRDLFYNTPARMKFLKKDLVEANAIAGVMDKIALSHPEISFRFLREGRETLHTPGSGDLKQAIYAVYGRDFTKGLIPVEYTYNQIRVWGYITRPASCRPNRSMQQFFINGRYVKSRTAMVALEEAFKGTLMVGKFPACVLHLSISCAAVDVNVHPAKIEVRFINERPIFDSVYHGVKTALSRGDETKTAELSKKQAGPLLRRPEPPVQTRLPETPVRRTDAVYRPEPQQPASVPSYFVQDSGARRTAPVQQPETASVLLETLQRTPRPAAEPVPQTPPEATAPEAGAALSSPQISQNPDWNPSPKPAESCSEMPLKTEPEQEIRVCGEIFDTYILAQYGKDQLLLIDKHAAHERMLYEKLKASAGASAQQLLQPISVTLGKEEYAAVLENLPILQEAGFEAEDFGPGTILIRSVPLYLDAGSAAGTVMEIAGYLAEHRTDVTTERLDWLYHNIACRAAIKAGKESSMEELVDLVRRLQANPEIRYCPHGRPVSVKISKREFDRQFGRV